MSAQMKLKVIVVGAGGETGRSVMAALLTSPDQFSVTAFARTSSASGAVYKDFAARGAEIKGVDYADKAGLVAALKGVDIVLSCIQLDKADVQNALIEASHKAGVGRFVPSFWATVCPPRGVMELRGVKEDSLDKIKALYLPYTAIDVGWWYQIGVPSLPSGKLDEAMTAPSNEIFGDGTVPTAMIDQADIGRFVARIIADPRTLNKLVFAYGEVTTQNAIVEIVEKHSGETIPRKHVSLEEAENIIKTAGEALAANPADMQQLIAKHVTEYKISWAIRGDNAPERAEYLGYLDARELYPDIKPKSMDEFVKELVAGDRTAMVYASNGPST